MDHSPSGFRLAFPTEEATFPDPEQAGEPPCYDADGASPIYIGSAIFEDSVHPCKVRPYPSPHALVPFAGTEVEHEGRYDLLPYNPETMEFVAAADGVIPEGRQPIEGGYEDHGAKLYHAVGVVDGVRVPGKTAEHLGGCNVAFSGEEHVITEGYEILCWR